MADNGWLWALALQQQAEQAAAARSKAEADAKAKADADAKAAADAETKRQAQIATQRQTDAAAAQSAEQARLASLANLPGAADPYGEYRASMQLDNSATQNAARMVSTGSPTGNPMSGFASQEPKASSLAGMFSAAVAPRPQRGPDFAQSGRNVSGGQSTGGGSARMF